MKSLLTLGLISFALTFCGLGDRLKQLTGAPGSNSSTASGNTNSSSNSATKSSSTDTVEKPKLTAEQQAILDAGVETKWDDQGITWRLPKGWSKMDVKKETFNYKSADNAFLLVNISIMPDTFPMDVSLKAYYDQAIEQVKNGKYAQARLLEIDGIQGVEFVESSPESKDDPRRHQWIAYRTYLGQKQMLNVMTSTKGTNFDKHKDDFPTILYSMKFIK